MIAMKALVGFSDIDLATEYNPSGSQSANVPFNAPSADVAKRIEGAGLAVRDAAPAKSDKA